ncbi:MAG: glycosyltransferase family 4 protein [Flavobacteriaceae bacterium]|nr:glycosyltransferase family 4 protein [Flavobacteriaceae bacterium]
MNFAIFTHVQHKFYQKKWYAYEPYVREMNLWIKHVSETLVVSPISSDNITDIESYFIVKNIKFHSIDSFNLLNLENIIKAILKIPSICFQIYKAMKWADHIHLRCPGNIGLVGSIVQIFFPSKPKTIKYAGNWDPNSKQPWSYRLQKRIVSNTFLTRNAKVLVYGNWPNQSKNIIPFFTATYSVKDIIQIEKKELSNELRFIYVGALHAGKQPLLSVKVIQELKSKGYNVKLNMYGDGDEKEKLNLYIDKHDLKSEITMHGNKSADEVKQAYIEAHFLLFISKSEGWPKVVAEAMFWACVPITSRVSCVPWMLDSGRRGLLVNDVKNEIVGVIEKLLTDKEKYNQMSLNAQKWSHKYTLETFDNEIQKLINETN